MRSTMFSKTTRRLAVFLLPVLLAACAPQAPVPQDRFYRLQAVVASAPMTTPVLNGTLEIDRFTADGITAGRPIVYVEDQQPNQLQEYHYHFWTQAPTIMLRDELVTYLRAVNFAENVVTPEMRLKPDFVMTGRIRRLEQVRTASESAVIEIEIVVRRPDDGKLMFLKSYRHEAEQKSSGVAGAVSALSEGLNIVFADLLTDLQGL